MKTITKVKNYVKEHAPELIGAAACVVIAVTIRQARNDDVEFRQGVAHVIGVMNSNEIPFTYHPGIGVYADSVS